MPIGLVARLGGLAMLGMLPSAIAAAAETVPGPTPEQVSPPGQAAAASPPSPTPARAGRYTMVPAEGGFVRLDTETGIVSQCRRETPQPDAAWRCAAIPESVLSEPDRTAELAASVESLKREVADLRRRLDAEDRRAATAPATPQMDDAEYNRALDFSEELMRRFFGLVRDMKLGRDPNPT